ncbi:MAG: replication restart helicase PriA, partial [Chloroflexia bacterium]
MAGALYADVVVRQGARVVGTFSYSVPPALHATIAPGQVVWVPFRRSRLPAIVVALSEQPPDFETRDILEIADPTPVLTPTQIALGRWMAEHDLCTLAEALFAMLPPGLLGRPRTRVVLTEAGRSRPLEGLSPLARQAVEELRRSGGELDLAALARALRKRGLSGTLSRLEREGWLAQVTWIEEPTARPHREPFLVLSASPAQLAALRESLLAGRRNSPAARVLSTLARAPGGLRETRTLCQEVKAGPGAIAELEAEGLVRSLKERDLLRLVAPGAEVAAFLEKEARRFPRGCALVRRLQEAEGVLDLEAEPVPAEVWRALERRGLVRREHRPAQVRLSVLPEVALARAAALRRTRADERLLECLERLEQAEDRALPLSTLGREEAAALLEAGVARTEERERLRDPLAGCRVPPQPPPPLTERQGQVWREIYEAFGRGGTHTFLLHGVTGSGKTEVYLRALGRALRDGRQAVVLVPEISLTPQTVRRFAARFPGRVTVLHSGLSVGERYDQWRRVRAGQVDVVIGPRSALFAPLPRLGLIIIDEEHDDSYKQDDPPPRYHAREVALALARLTGSIVLLGSATPSVETYSRAREGHYRLLELPERIRVREDSTGRPLVLIQTSLPRVEVVDMREELRAGNTSIFSRSLQRALRETLEAGEQAILFLNRRGAATFVMCRDCGYVVRCPHCEVPYVYHADLGRLLCHRCGRKASVPASCPACRSLRIRHFGAGTERVEAEVLRLLPSARVLRWDRDVAEARGSYEEVLEAFARRKADVLVGTQMVAKGLDLPGVSLVGVVSADTVLHLPDFRSAERTFQLVTQVIGRAGRRPRKRAA